MPQSADHEIVQSALSALFTFSLSKEKYEEAQDYLNQIPGKGFDPNRFQAVLYERQGKTSEAYELFERLLLKSYRLGVFKIAACHALISFAVSSCVEIALLFL